MDQQTQPATRPFWAGKPARTTRRGHFWVTAERVTVSGSTYQRGPMYVS